MKEILIYFPRMKYEYMRCYTEIKVCSFTSERHFGTCLLEVFRCRAYDLCERKMSPFPDVELEGDSQRGLATNLF